MPDNENAIDGSIIVSREIYANGKNSCKINGRFVTVNELKEFMKDIIDIHGQNDTQKIMSKQSHIQYVDKYIGEPILKIKKEYKELYSRYIVINKTLKENYGDEKERQRKLDLLNYQLREINDANLKEGEEEKLEIEHKKMVNSEKISTSLIEADNCINENAIDSINMTIRALEKIEDYGEEYKTKLSELKNIYYDIQEIGRDICNLRNENEFDESNRDEIEARLDLIQSLKRKYGNSIREILEYKIVVQEDLIKIENIEEYNEKLRQERKNVVEKMKEIAKSMTRMRLEAANKLNMEITKQLQDLEMKNAKFSCRIEENKDFDENGLDNVEFMICTNFGDEEKSLIKIASGGEISRVMLAIKTILADSDDTPTMIFDEIDTGISGKAAKAVAEKMQIISKNHQVLCITHQANIAAKGDYNYFISKNIEGKATVTSIKQLNEDEVIQEIARISCGDITKTAIEHAKEMRKAC